MIAIGQSDNSFRGLVGSPALPHNGLAKRFSGMPKRRAMPMRVKEAHVIAKPHLASIYAKAPLASLQAALPLRLARLHRLR